MSKIRVLVVEDSLTIRKRLCEVLGDNPALEVVGEAADGKSAIELCQSLRPDCITMDMVLPVMSGLSATEYIMAHCPTPILVVSASTNRGELFKTYEALAAGAVDVLEKPSGHDDPDETWERRLIAAVQMVSRIRVITHPRGRLSSLARPPVASSSNGRAPGRVLAVGTSTGGPGAIVEVLRGLDPSVRAPLLLVIHINEPFGTAFANWLDGQSERRVSQAVDGESLADHAGCVLMAPPDKHLTIERGRVRLTNDPERHSCRPSVDVLFESVAREYGGAGVACLLTGMGRDGATGLLAVRQAGGLTIAQDEATSVVYGMPREAALLNAAERILPLAEIGPHVSRLEWAK